MPAQPGLADFLNRKAAEYNQPGFIAADPISLPHLFSRPQDIEIVGFFASLMAWGNRRSIIRSGERLIGLMEAQPYAFVTELEVNDFYKLSHAKGFVHRTFQPDDLMHLWQFLHYHYAIRKQDSLETAFSQWMLTGDETVENALNGFRDYVFSPEVGPHLSRTYKHVAAPYKKSACKRLCMFLRWMVRKDRQGVDFGLWKQIKPGQLVLPLDVHVARVARTLGLLDKPAANWQTALELTAQLRQLNPADPAVYDFALFGLGVEEKF